MVQFKYKKFHSGFCVECWLGWGIDELVSCWCDKPYGKRHEWPKPVKGGGKRERYITAHIL